MGKLRISTAMTIDGVIEVSDWYVPEGGHDPPRSSCWSSPRPY
jgi:hypothetical protein